MTIIEMCPVCGGDLMDLMIATYPPIPAKRCNSCGWHWEGEREEIVRVPFVPPQPANDMTPECCRNCKNHPKNGGSGICSCALPYMTHTGQDLTYGTKVVTIPAVEVSTAVSTVSINN